MKPPNCETEESEISTKCKVEEMNHELNGNVDKDAKIGKKRKKKKKVEDNESGTEDAPEVPVKKSKKNKPKIVECTEDAPEVPVKKSKKNKPEIVEQDKSNLENVKVSDQEDDETVRYSAKEVKHFTGKAFRTLLSSDDAFKALHKFIVLHETDKKRDLAAEYIQAKGSVLEILELLDIEEKKNITNTSLVFSAVHILIIKILSKFPDHIQATEQACHHLINSYLHLIHSMLSSQSKAKNRKLVLKLLAAIVTIGDPFPREILNHLSLHSELVEFLIMHIRPTDEESVRICFIHFILAFLVEGDSSVIRTLLEKRGVVSSIFSGLIYDYPETVQLVMTTIKKYVLENPAISKTIKLHVFSTQVIQGIVNLYNWKGPKNWPGNKKYKSAITEDVNQEQKEIAVNVVHDFLITLLTSNRHGIAFHDRKLGLDSSRKHNQLINTVLQRLDKPWEHEKPSELVVRILTTCPDLIKSQLLLAEPYFVPRVSKKWISLIEFTRKIIENVSIENCLKFCTPDMTLVQLTNAITNLTLPQIVIKGTIVPSLEHSSPIVHYEIIKLVQVMTRKMQSFLVALDTVKSNINNIPALKRNLQAQLSKHIPSFETILTIWTKALSTLSDQSSDDSDEKDLYVDVKDRLLSILDLLQDYSEICPEILLSTTYGEHKPEILLTSLSQVENTTEEELTIMKVKALKILLYSDTTSFAPEKKIFTSSLSFLITKVGHEDPLLDFEIRKTVKLLLNSCGVFEGHNEQIDVWIDAITYIENPEDKLEVANWIAKMIKRVSKNIEKYIPKIIETEESAEEEIIKGNQIDDVFDELLERNIKDTKSVTPMLPITSICLLVYGAVENLKMNPSDAVAHYFSIIMVHTLHFQVSSKALSSLVEDLKIPSQKYLTSWLNENSPCTIVKPFSSNNVFRCLSKILLDPCKDCSVEVKELLLCITIDGKITKNQMSNFDLMASLRMVIFYLTQAMRKTDAEISNILVYKNTLLSLLRVAKAAKIDSEYLIRDCLRWIFKHPIILHFFKGIYDGKESAEFVSTKLYVEICEANKEFLESSFIQPYQEKFINLIKSMVKKYNNSQKKIKMEVPVELIEVLQLEVKDIVDLLNIILDLKKIDFVTPDKSELSIWGNLVPILIKKISTGDNKNEIGLLTAIQEELLKKLFQHLIDLKNFFKQDMSSWEINLYDYLLKFSYCISAVSVKTFTKFIETKLTSVTEKVITLLCEKNFKFITAFVKHSNDKKSMLKEKSLIFSILSSNLKYQWTQEFISKIYEIFKNDIIQYLTELKVDDVPWISAYVDAAAYLIDKNFDSKLCMEISDTILSNGNKLDAAQEEHVKLYHRLFKKSMIDDPNAFKNFTQLLLHITVTALKKDAKNVKKLNYLCETFIDTITTLKAREKDFTFPELSNNHFWPQFVRISLKSGLKPPKEDNTLFLIKALSTACEVAYKNNDCEEYVKTIFAMVTLHTEFKEIMTSDTSLKGDLAELLWVLVKKNHEIMSEAHIPIYLCAYNATLSKSDQFILKILQHYESNGKNFSHYSPFYWGKAAESHFNTDVSLGTALYRDRSIAQVLELLVPEKILHTIEHFPIRRNVQGDFIHVEDADQIYDPAFYLAIFCTLLKDCNDVPCHKVVHKGGLALTIIACTSTCESTRSAAYTVLSRFYCHLHQLGKSTKEKLLWTHFIDALRNGTAKLEQPLEKIRLNGFVATFLARAIQVMTQPLNPLYSPLHAFLMAKPALDLDVIPEFLPLFHSSEVEHTAHRHWILEIVRDGFKNNGDMDVALKYLLFKMLFSYYNCTLADDITKKLILQVIRSATKLTRGCTLLIQGYSLLPWLVNASKNAKKDDVNSISCIIDIVNNIDRASQKGQLKKIHHNLLVKILLHIKSNFNQNISIDCYNRILDASNKIIKNDSVCDVN